MIYSTDDLCNLERDGNGSWVSNPGISSLVYASKADWLSWLSDVVARRQRKRLFSSARSNCQAN